MWSRPKPNPAELRIDVRKPFLLLESFASGLARVSLCSGYEDSQEGSLLLGAAGMLKDKLASS